MRIFKHRGFVQWMKSEGIKDETLIKAVHEIEGGLHDGNLGGGLYKKRVAMPGKGKRGSYRTLLAIQHGEHAFFLYGFAKNVKANINEKEKGVYKKLAAALLDMKPDMLNKMLKTSTLIEVK